jgi:hypothetical protein
MRIIKKTNKNKIKRREVGVEEDLEGYNNIEEDW